METYDNNDVTTKECDFSYTKGHGSWHLWSKLCGFIHYNVQYVVFIVACIALKLEFDIGCATDKGHKKVKWQQEENEQQITPFHVIIVAFVKKKHNNNNKKKKKGEGEQATCRQERGSLHHHHCQPSNASLNLGGSR